MYILNVLLKSKWEINKAWGLSCLWHFPYRSVSMSDKLEMIDSCKCKWTEREREREIHPLEWVTFWSGIRSRNNKDIYLFTGNTSTYIMPCSVIQEAIHSFVILSRGTRRRRRLYPKQTESDELICWWESWRYAERNMLGRRGGLRMVVDTAHGRRTRDADAARPSARRRRWPTTATTTTIGEKRAPCLTMDIYISTIWIGSNAFRRELSIDYVCILVTVVVFPHKNIFCTNSVEEL